jgi:uncharacterized protein (TIGR02246 family)
MKHHRVAVPLAVAALCAVSSSNMSFAAKPINHDADEAAIRSQADSYTKAFAAGDAKTVAEMWETDGTYTDTNGREYKGRADIQNLFASYFTKFGGKSMVISIQSIAFPSANVAIEQGSARLADGGSASKYLVVHTKNNGTWHMMAVTETPLPQPVRNTLSDLGWLAGRWSAKNDTATVHFSGSIDKKNHFLGLFLDSPTDPGSHSMEVVTWNPASQRVVSWHFDASGSFGNGTFMRSGDTWYEKAHGIEPDGSSSRATNIIHRITNDKFTWQSTDRAVGGVRLPDTAEITVTRDSASK